MSQQLSTEIQSYIEAHDQFWPCVHVPTDSNYCAIKAFVLNHLILRTSVSNVSVGLSHLSTVINDALRTHYRSAAGHNGHWHVGMFYVNHGVLRPRHYRWLLR